MRRTIVTRNNKIVIALSGGVDSSVAAALLMQQQQSQQPQQLTALHMSNWDTADDDSIRTCTSEQDWQDARNLAQHLKLDIHRVSCLQSDYWVSVFEPFIQNLHQHGIMGNPDIACNTHVKFGALQNYIRKRYGTSAPQKEDVKLATGHYARLWHNRLQTVPACVEHAVQLTNDYETIDWLRHWGSSDTPLLLAAADTSKDQSYFLSGCHAASLGNVLFPLGDYFKNNNPNDEVNQQPTVRQLAHDWNLPAATKRESMGICFVGKRRTGFASFVQDYLPAPPTKRLQFVDIDHQTILHRTDEPMHHVLYTIGQGAKLSGLSEKYFIVDHNHHLYSHDSYDIFHTVTVCAGTHHPALYSDSFTVQSVHWMGGWPPPSSGSPSAAAAAATRIRAQCRTRHLQPLVDCTIEWTTSATSSSTAVAVYLDQPLRGLTIGQQAVFYTLSGTVCLGGGPIATRGPSYHEQNKQVESNILL